MAPINLQICFNNEELINELVQNVLGDFIDVIETPDNDFQDTEIDDIIEEMLDQ